jgi:hypothetical protein
MLERPIPIAHIAPWLVSGASGLYVIIRARRLSLAKASHAPLPRFLVRQSDLILMLCGGPVVWHFARRQRLRRMPHGTHAIAFGATAYTVHQLRQVFTALQLGTGLLARKIASGKISDLPALAQRLDTIVRAGSDLLEMLDAPHLPDLTDECGRMKVRHAGNNGA